MKLDDLRKRQQQRDSARPKTSSVAQEMDVYADRVKGIGIQFRPPFTGAYLTMTTEQGYNHGLTVLAASIACGAKFDKKELEAKVAELNKILDADEAKARARHN